MVIGSGGSFSTIKGSSSNSNAGSIMNSGSLRGGRQQQGGHRLGSNIRGMNDLASSQQSSAHQRSSDRSVAASTRQERRAAAKAAAKSQKKAFQGPNKAKSSNTSAYAHSVGKPRCGLVKCTDVVTSLAAYCDGCERSYCNKHAEGGAKAHSCDKKKGTAEASSSSANESSGSTSNSTSESTCNNTLPRDTSIEQALDGLTLDCSDQTRAVSPSFIPVDFSGSTDENCSN